ncbi:MAG: holo-ACP synthase, malonate decarboxylase-specific [Rhizobacter sp.]|nr:holo-ACP synthase, malonate decarboxylase-specific [Rhizobacter sp.]
MNMQPGLCEGRLTGDAGAACAASLLLQRHRLVRLSPTGWQRVLDRNWDAQAGECLELWGRSQFPLVVTRQRVGAQGIALGLPAPERFGRRRLALEVDANDLLSFDEFPLAQAMTPLLHGSLHDAWRALCAGLADVGCMARVYGSHGWQAITRLPYLHAESDLDLMLAVDGPAMADAVCTVLAASPIGRPRLDGELLFGDGAAVAWREWHRWRAGLTRQVLVKRLEGVGLETEAAFAQPLPC